MDIDLIIHPAIAGYPVGWFQPTYKSLLEVWRTLKSVCRPIMLKKGGVSEQDKRIELITGGVIECWSLDNDPEGCRGRKYKRVVINEAAKVRDLQTAWELSIFPTLADYRGDAWFPSTPRGRDFYHELFAHGQDDDPQWDGWKSWQLPTRTNPKLPEGEVELARRMLPTTVFLQEYEAQFLDVAGAFFDEWEPDRKIVEYNHDIGEYVTTSEPWHVVDPFPVPAHWRVWASEDYGTTAAEKSFAQLIFTSDDHGVVYVIGEIYAAGKLAPEQAQMLLEYMEGLGIAHPRDDNNREGETSLWDTRLDYMAMDWAHTFPPENPAERIGKYPVEHFWERGLPVIRAVKDRQSGWQTVKLWMHNTVKCRGKDGNDDVKPMLQVFKGRCSNLIRILPLMIRDEKEPEDLDQTVKERHLADTLRYGLHTPTEAARAKSTKSDWSGQTRNLSTGALADSRVVTVGSARTITSPSALPAGTLDKYDRPAGF